MTAKFMSLQEISIRPQNDHDQILLKNLSDLVISGKKPSVRINEKGDFILEVKSTK